MSFRLHFNDQCRGQHALELRLASLADSGLPAIDERLTEIEREWSAGRMTKATIGVMILTGIALVAIANPWWLALPALGGLFLLQYLFGRSSWLGTAFHEMGFRTGSEIDQEKFALKALRGDFRNLPSVHEIENKDDIARLEGEGGIVVEPEEARPDTREVVRDALQAAKS